MERITHYKPLYRIKPLSFKKLVVVLVLAGILPFPAIMHFAHYILILVSLFLLLQALVTGEPEKVSRYISYFIIAALFSFAHSALAWKFTSVSEVSLMVRFIADMLHVTGGRDFLVKSSLLLGLFLIAHTALVRFTVSLTGASTGHFMGKRVPYRGTGIIRDRGNGIVLQNDFIQDRRSFVRVGHYFSPDGNIGTMIYRSYIAILGMIVLMLMAVVLYKTGNPQASGNEFFKLFASAVVYALTGLLPFTVITLATALLATRLTYRHSVAA